MNGHSLDQTTEDEMAGWHHWLDGRESQWTPGVGDGQGRLACCDSWSRKESDTSERLIWSDLIVVLCLIFKETAKLFSRVTRPFSSYSSYIQFLCIFSKILALSLYDFSHSIGIQWYLIAVSICISLMGNDVKHVVTCLFTICISSLMKYLFMSFTHFPISFFYYLLYKL